jgi:hypothetical protein
MIQGLLRGVYLRDDWCVAQLGRLAVETAATFQNPSFEGLYGVGSLGYLTGNLVLFEIGGNSVIGVVVGLIQDIGFYCIDLYFAN